jgi:hypothetical protein
LKIRATFRDFGTRISLSKNVETLFSKLLTTAQLHSDYYSTTPRSVRRMRNHKGCWSRPSLRAPLLRPQRAPYHRRSIARSFNWPAKSRVAKRSRSRGGGAAAKPNHMHPDVSEYTEQCSEISKLSVRDVPNDRRLKAKRELTCAYCSTCRWVMRPE